MTDTTHIRFAVLASDVAVCTLRDGELLMRFIQVNRPPHFVHMNGLPGGLLDPKEDAEQAAKRHVESRAGIAASKLFMEQLYTFSAIDRDPRGRVVAVTYLALVPWEKLSAAEQIRARRMAAEQEARRSAGRVRRPDLPPFRRRAERHPGGVLGSRYQKAEARLRPQRGRIHGYRAPARTHHLRHAYRKNHA